VRRFVVLGPQRRPTLDRVIRTLDIEGPIATVTAGWREREPDDAELDGYLGGRGANLRLYARWLDVLERDPELADAEREHRTVVDQLQELYLVQLDAVLRALAEVRRRGTEGVRDGVLADAEESVRLVDQRHLERVRAERERFAQVWRPAERAAVAEHCAAVRHVLERVGCLVVAGGHVGVLLHRLRLFGVDALLPPTVVAWSAGAMALTERIVLFHHVGSGNPEFAEYGLGALPGCVLLPHARRRLPVDDPERMAELVARVAPSRCLVLDDGVRVDIGADGSLSPGARVVTPEGRVGTVDGT
jgi:hypothetical protein